MSLNNGNGRAPVGKLLFVEKLYGRVVCENLGDACGLENAKTCNNLNEVGNWDEVKKLSSKQQDNTYVVVVIGRLSDVVNLVNSKVVRAHIK